MKKIHKIFTMMDSRSYCCYMLVAEVGEEVYSDYGSIYHCFRTGRFPRRDPYRLAWYQLASIVWSQFT